MLIKNLVISIEQKIKIRKKLIHELIESLKSDLDFELESLEINIVSQKSIHELNKKYLSHDFTTDIITFNYSGENYNLDGEVFVSLEDACENAVKYKVSLQMELTRLIIHGILHLLGYDDIRENDKKKMKRLENRLVKKYAHFSNYKIVEYDC